MNGGLEKMLGFGKRYRIEGEKLENPSRRSFLGTVSKGALVAGLTATGYLKSESALAENLYTDPRLPPGFQICKDSNLVMAYLSMLGSGGYNQSRIKDILTRKGGWVEGNMRAETPLSEPAYWFTKDYFNYKYQNQGGDGMINFEDLNFFNKLNLNPAMYNWAKGINMYFKTWIDSRKRYGSIQETETYLLRAIFTAAGRSESEVENYKQLDLTLKERTLNLVMQDLKKQDYTNQLIASWSVYCLGIHYEVKIKNGPESDIIYNQIEMPLRKLNPNFKIRGPPSYGI